MVHAQSSPWLGSREHAYCIASYFRKGKNFANFAKNIVEKIYPALPLQLQSDHHRKIIVLAKILYAENNLPYIQ